MKLNDIVLRALELSTSEATKEYAPEESYRLLQAWRQFFVVNLRNGVVSLPEVKR